MHVAGTPTHQGPRALGGGIWTISGQSAPNTDARDFSKISAGSRGDTRKSVGVQALKDRVPEISRPHHLGGPQKPWCSHGNGGENSRVAKCKRRHPGEEGYYRGHVGDFGLWDMGPLTQIPCLGSPPWGGNTSSSNSGRAPDRGDATLVLGALFRSRTLLWRRSLFCRGADIRSQLVFCRGGIHFVWRPSAQQLFTAGDRTLPRGGTNPFWLDFILLVGCVFNTRWSSPDCLAKRSMSYVAHDQCRQGFASPAFQSQGAIPQDRWSTISKSLT